MKAFGKLTIFGDVVGPCQNPCRRMVTAKASGVMAQPLALGVAAQVEFESKI